MGLLRYIKRSRIFVRSYDPITTKAMPMEDVKSKQVFNYLFEKAKAEGIPLNPMKAIKLVYFCHAWYLGFKSKPLLTEPIQAWQYGAVVPSLYHALKIYGAGNISYPILKDQEDRYLDIYLKDTNEIKKSKEISYTDLTPEETEVINLVWDGYKNLNAGDLSSIMHQPGTPWTQTWNDGNCGRYAVIDNSTIQAFYQEKIRTASND